MHTYPFFYRSFLFELIFEFLAAKNCDKKVKFLTYEIGQFFCVCSLEFSINPGMKLKYNFVISTCLKCEESNAEHGF